MPANWFVAIQGKRQGPLTTEQVKQLAVSGQLKPADMVMQEGAGKWGPASAIRDLFPQNGIQATPAPAVPSPGGAPQFYYAQNKQRFGPVSHAQLKNLASLGQLQPTDMVNQVGSPGWAPAQQIAGLYDDGGKAGRKGPGAIGKLGGAAKSLFGGARDMAVAASQEAARRAKMGGLRKEIDRQQEELDKKLPREIGSQLLNDNVRVPGCEQILKTFGRLNRDFNMANQAAMSGDKDKKKAAAKIGQDLEPLMTSYGQAALDTPVAFENRAECLQRRNKLAAEIKEKKAQLAQLEKDWQGTSKGKKRRVMAAFVLVAATLLVGVGVVGWMLKDSLFVGGHAAATGTGTAPAEPDKPLPLPELFAKLAPSVPQIEAMGAGTGSGFLVESEGKLIVVTNRHVVEDASSGVAVHFLRSNGSGGEEKLTIPANECKVIAIHQHADIALIDVNASADKIRDTWKIAPVKLAPKDNAPRVGENVFAIGHPGAGGGEAVLTRTLSNGIISATGRKMEFSPGSFTQVTVPINPGNSGGPLFDDRGRVLAINTFIIRRGSGGVSLEGLNFCLEVSSLHELLEDKSKSMDAGKIAAIMGSIKPGDTTNPLGDRAKTMAKEWEKRGYHYFGGSSEKGQRLFRLAGGQVRFMEFNFRTAKDYTIGIVSSGAPDIDMQVLDPTTRRIIAKDSDDDPSPVVQFKVGRNGNFVVIVINPTSSEALVHMSLFEK